MWALILADASLLVTWPRSSLNSWTELYMPIMLCNSVSDCILMAFGPMALTGLSGKGTCLYITPCTRSLECGNRDSGQWGVAPGVQAYDLVLMVMMIEGKTVKDPWRNVVARGPGLDRGELCNYLLHSILWSWLSSRTGLLAVLLKKPPWEEKAPTLAVRLIRQLQESPLQTDSLLHAGKI